MTAPAATAELGAPVPLLTDTPNGATTQVHVTSRTHDGVYIEQSMTPAEARSYADWLINAAAIADERNSYR